MYLALVKIPEVQIRHLRWTQNSVSMFWGSWYRATPAATDQFYRLSTDAGCVSPRKAQWRANFTCCNNQGNLLGTHWERSANPLGSQ